MEKLPTEDRLLAMQFTIANLQQQVATLMHYVDSLQRGVDGDGMVITPHPEMVRIQRDPDLAAKYREIIQGIPAPTS